MSPPPKTYGIRETALYVTDLVRARDFYRDSLGLAVMLDTPRLAALDAGASGVLLLFQAGATSDDLPTEGGVVPGHEGTGRLHMAFAIAEADYDAWKAHLAGCGIALDSEVAWPQGGRSLYIRDPDGHAVEFVTPGVWPNG